MDARPRSAPGDATLLRISRARAAGWLRERGFEILARNHAVPRGEVDLVCREGDVLCFVEVRSRTSEAQGGPEETVGRKKARRVVAAALTGR